METKDFSVASKSQLAKLLATENLVIQHQKMATAKFDPVNRVLYCPVWQDMSGSLYDLLLGHEVGHALYTPADGWHDAVCSRGNKYKHFLNVVEDARIEKKIKRRYPGIRRSFIDGYTNLMQRDFFGIIERDVDVNELPFIDRLNLFTKSSYTMDIQFTDFETTLLEKVKNAETWSEVLEVTEEIWNYSKDEQSQMLMDQIIMDESFDSDYDETEEYELDSDSFEEDNLGKSNSSGDSDESEESEDSEDTGNTKSSGDADEDAEDDEVPQGINRHKESQISSGPQKIPENFEPSCVTDEVYREQEVTLLDRSARPFVYINMPDPILENIVTPHSRVQYQLTDYYVMKRGETERTRLLNNFKRKNERYISLLVKEFEMRKAADRFSKAKVSTTGDLDISKLYKYQVDDTIFRKAMRVPQGKSHGLILLLDKSGSMADNLKGSIEQILILASFCRKVNIPFTVYGFGNSDISYEYDKNQSAHKTTFFKKDSGNLNMKCVMLREYLNSKMSNSEFTTACKNMLCLGESYGRYHGHYGQHPRSEELSNTPLNEALVATAKITNIFKKENNLDIVNLVIINDGDADYIGQYVSDKDGYKSYVDPVRNNVIIQDGKIKFQSDNVSYENQQSAIMKWFTAKTGAKIFGFYLMHNGSRGVKSVLYRQYYENGMTIVEACKGDMTECNNKIKNIYDLVRKNKFVNSAKPGYHSFFLIPGGSDLEVDEDQIEIDTTKKVTTGRLASAFRRYNEKRQLNRVLVNQFIEGIAK